MNKLLIAVLLTILQCVLFLTLVNLFVHFYSLVVSIPRFDIGWGISLRIAFVEFTLITLVANVFHLKQKNHWVIIFISFVLFGIYWAQYFSIIPLRIIMLLTIVLICFLSYFLFNLVIKSLFRLPV